MKPSTKNEVQGKLREMKGKAKEAIGKRTKNPDLMDEGTAEKIDGKVQKKIGQIGKVFGR
jgi:uncharacterized protein YjbJ (UPF0337 family)